MIITSLRCRDSFKPLRSVTVCSLCLAREVSELEFTLGVNMYVTQTGVNVNPYELRNAAILQEKKTSTETDIL